MRSIFDVLVISANFVECRLSFTSSVRPRRARPNGNYCHLYVLWYLGTILVSTSIISYPPRNTYLIEAPIVADSHTISLYYQLQRR